MHPLGLNLHFMFSRGFLSAQNRRINAWASIESLRMEIPDLSFPFDARGGVARFQHTRCRLRQMRISISESGLEDLFSSIIRDLPGYDEPRLRFVQGAVHFSIRLTALGNDTFLTFKLSAIPPEPTHSDTLHLFFHDIRAYGPLPYPSRIVVSELLKHILDSPHFAPFTSHTPFAIEHRGDLIQLRPLHTALLTFLTPEGWKLPSMVGLSYDAITIQPGSITLSAHSEGHLWERPQTDPLAATASSSAGAHALAAYEARDLLQEADDALFSGQLPQALQTLRSLLNLYGLHPSITHNLLDLLTSSPGPGHLAEAQSITHELLRAEPNHTTALLFAPTLALLRGHYQDASNAYNELASSLRSSNQNYDLTACLLASAQLHQQHDPNTAVRVLRDVIQLAPRNRTALESLRTLYTELDQVDGLIETLKRLAGLYSERDKLLDVYQNIAELLINRRNDLPEARLYLEKILRLDPTRVQTLFTLGQSYVLDNQPLRAIKTFSSAARFAVQNNNTSFAAELHLKTADLWSSLDDTSSALLAARRALQLQPSSRHALQHTIQLALSQNHHDEALRHLSTLLPLLDEDIDLASSPHERARAAHTAVQAHLTSAKLAEERGRIDTAASHHRRALYTAHTHLIDDPKTHSTTQPSIDYLDAYYRQMGRPEDLLELHRTRLQNPHLSDPQRASIHQTLALVFDQHLHLPSEASQHLQHALSLNPNDPSPLEALVLILSQRHRLFELQEILSSLLQNTTDRRARARILLEQGRLLLSSLSQPDEAANVLREAQTISPAHVDIAQALVDAELQRLKDDAALTLDGRDALRALERLAEVAQTPQTQHQALLQAADLCLERLDLPTEAAAFYTRANDLFPSQHTRERIQLAQRRSSLSPIPNTPPQPTQPQPTRPQPARPQPARPQPTPPVPTQPQLLPNPTPPPTPPTAPTSRPAPRFGIPTPPTPTSPTPKPQTPPTPTLSNILSSPDLPSVEPSEPQTPPITLSSLNIAPEPQPIPTTPPDSLSSFRSQFQNLISQPVSLEDSIASIRRIQLSSKTTPDTPPTHPPTPPTTAPPDFANLAQLASSLTPPKPSPPAPNTPPPSQRLLEIQDISSPSDKHTALLTLLDTPNLPQHLEARIQRDLGINLYYDLEDPQQALQHLLRARELDPDSIASEFETLTALEGIYEDLDQPEGLVDVYREKRTSAQDLQMRQVYGILMAELLFERLEQPDEARNVLNDVLHHQPENESALRMLADIARAQGDTSEALDILRRVTQQQAPGSFERHEALRELGRLLLQHARLDPTPSPPSQLDALHEAATVFRNLLDEVPGDSQALSSLKEALTRSGQHHETFLVLGTELGLLLGQPEAFPKGPTPEALQDLSISTPLTIAASHIVTDAAHATLADGDIYTAAHLLSVAVNIAPENLDALNQRIDLLRTLLDSSQDAPNEHTIPLARDLETLANYLLDPLERFHTLLEATHLYLSTPPPHTHALELLNEALALTSQFPDTDEATVQAVDQAFQLLNELSDLPAPTTQDPAPPLSEVLLDGLDNLPDTFHTHPIQETLLNASNAEEQRDRTRMLQLFQDALPPSEDTSTPPHLLRQLLIRYAQTLLGLRPDPQRLGSDDTTPHEPSQDDTWTALQLLDRALLLHDADEPEAYFLRIHALRHIEADPTQIFDTILQLAERSTLWDEEYDIDESDSELEDRILLVARETLAKLPHPEAQDPFLESLSLANPRIAKRLQDPTTPQNDP